MSQVYDSDLRPRVFVDTFRAFWSYRELITLLVRRDIAVRYKRSFLGLAWSLLNPLLTSLVLWVVFTTIFSSRLPAGTSFAPFLVAGVLLINFFTQGFNQAADAIAGGAGVLMKVYVPPQVFAFAGAVSNAVNFVFGLFALVIVALLAGDGISWMFFLSVFVIIAMLLFVTGLGLWVSVLYIRYNDSRNIITVLVSFSMYLAPVFYPKEALNATMQKVVSFNSLTAYLEVFRNVFLGIGSASLGAWLYMILSAIAMLFIGIRSFVRNWPRTVVML